MPATIKFKTGRLLVGDCIERLKDLEDASIDSIVTDPPYELSFMSKSWDSSGVAYSGELWAEALRVLKPGGHLLAFGGTRTWHRLAVAIEDAGFEIRDSIAWMYGSGFPKSLDVSKAIDKMSGAEREVVGRGTKGQRISSSWDDGDATGVFRAGADGYDITAPATPDAARWQGWGTALKPAHEPIVVARKPLTGTVAANVLEHGTGALNIDGCRIGTEERTYNLTMTPGNFETTGGGKNVKSGTATVHGRWPANVVLTHTPDCEEFACDYCTNGYLCDCGQANGEGQVTSYRCVESCPVAELDRQSGISNSSKTSTKRPSRREGSGWDRPCNETHDGEIQAYGDRGGASRFFYIAKASQRERNAGLQSTTPIRHADRPSSDKPGGDNPRNRTNQPRKNFHPTVKPLTLMRWLCRLTTPPGGTVLDPFLGSGTTAVAAIAEGFNWVGCEMTEEYLPIIKDRVKHAQREKAKEQPALPES